MKIDVVRNAKRNIVFGIIEKADILLFPFIIRSVMIYTMGNLYVGLNGLFTSVLSFLNISELGIENAIIFCMYESIANDDEETICKLLNYYRKLYRIVGLVILGVGLLLIPFLPHLIHGKYPSDINLYILYLIYLFNSVISYWMFAYKGALFSAFQRTDISSKIMAIANTVCYSLQIVVLILARDYYYYILLLPVGTILVNCLKQIYAKRMFPQYVPRGDITAEKKAEIGKKIRALFGSKLSFFVLHASDNIVISYYFGLEKVTQYENYYYIVNLLISVTGIVYASILGGIGNKLEVQSDEINRQEFLSLTFLNLWMTMFCTVSMICMYQPFIKLWVGEAMMFDTLMMIMFVMYFFMYQMYRITLVYKEAAGVWWEDRFRPYVVMAANLIGNLVLSYFIGIYGVILSTLISLLISIPWANHTVLKYVFSGKSFGYHGKLWKYTLVTVFLAALFFVICAKIPVEGFAGLIIRGVICVIFPNALFALIFMKTKEFGQMNYLLGRILKKKA